MGTNHDEGRTFTQGFASLHQAAVRPVRGPDLRRAGARDPAALPVERLPQPVHRLIRHRGDLDRQRFPRRDRRVPHPEPGRPVRPPDTHVLLPVRRPARARAEQPDLPGYQWGAGHAMELAYLWPSFGNGTSLYDQLTPAQLELSHQMIVWWGAFARLGAPDAPGQPYWPDVHQPPADVAAPGRPERARSRRPRSRPSTSAGSGTRRRPRRGHDPSGTGPGTDQGVIEAAAARPTPAGGRPATPYWFASWTLVVANPFAALRPHPAPPRTAIP